MLACMLSVSEDHMFTTTTDLGTDEFADQHLQLGQHNILVGHLAPAEDEAERIRGADGGQVRSSMSCMSTVVCVWVVRGGAGGGVDPVDSDHHEFPQFASVRLHPECDQLSGTADLCRLRAGHFRGAHN